MGVEYRRRHTGVDGPGILFFACLMTIAVVWIFLAFPQRTASVFNNECIRHQSVNYPNQTMATKEAICFDEVVAWQYSSYFDKITWEF